LKKTINIALVGNPNCGKSSLFNELTGLKQKVGNFPGVTVDKKTGTCPLSDSVTANFIDLPGTYSLYPRKADEQVSYKVIMGTDDALKPDLIVLVADASNLRRNLLFCTQIIDLGMPVVMALTMTDLAKEKGIRIDIGKLEDELHIPVITVNPRKGKGIPELKKRILQRFDNKNEESFREFIYSAMLAPKAVKEIQHQQSGISDYKAIHYLIHHDMLIAEKHFKEQIHSIGVNHLFNPVKTQAEEILQRYARIRHIIQLAVKEIDTEARSRQTEKWDNILLHRFWGYAILLVVLFFLFQSVFWIAEYPMTAIEWSFGQLSGWLGNMLPVNRWSDLLINGVVSGLSGILVFVPQIMILFGLITLLEDSGYMARISFLTDRVMRRAGLNGKSVMPMISGYACAVPAIMSARSIENNKERLITILVTPFMSCSARLPVYTILIALVIPEKLIFGFISLQGMVMMLLYLFGTFMALITARILKALIRSAEKSYFILELPVYRSPRWKNLFYTMLEKARIFITDAGKVIMIISLLLWVLSSFGPSKKMDAVRQHYATAINQHPDMKEKWKNDESRELLENSWAGHAGKIMEPVLQPLGFDWKIGIAIITSFAAREVFVGTMATLYSVGYAENEATLTQKMQAAVRKDGTKVYTLATGLSLLIFYVLAMQCMSTLAVVKRETGSWTWPLIQLTFMTGLAFLFSWIVYNLFA
jgi:ferrous iron transport protein B